jgi:hypothetical protein
MFSMSLNILSIYSILFKYAVQASVQAIQPVVSFHLMLVPGAVRDRHLGQCLRVGLGPTGIWCYLGKRILSEFVLFY